MITLQQRIDELPEWPGDHLSNDEWSFVEINAARSRLALVLDLAMKGDVRLVRHQVDCDHVSFVGTHGPCTCGRDELLRSLGKLK